nr:retrotransposon protein, putative, Ty1-copia subclass [Tanacetum cinerariifolium]
VTLGLGVSLILMGLRKEYDGFVQNYNMHSMGKTVNELHAMLKFHEQTLPKSNAPALNAIRAGKVQKSNKHKKSHSQKGVKGQNQGKGKFVPKPKIPPPPKRENPVKDSICHDLYVGNGQHEAVKAIGTFYLCLPSGLEIVLNNCHYAPSITRGVISVFRLYDDGFVNRFVDNTIQVSRNNVVYFSAVRRDDIFKINLTNSLTNESSVYAVSNKRAKLDLDSALLWHCRLGHISKKRIERLQHDGLLNSSDLRAFEKCVSCMSGKMARKPYTHQVERAKDLLGLIHTDVCGPFKIMSRQGASYFVTFTDDYSRYSYVYLLKHKHEVFETFKVFQKEVENQLEKTIKSLCSDRWGEYMSQEFLDHLKDHGIIAQRTPPYTSQHNGYPKATIGNSFYYPPENKVIVARNAKFLENSLIDQEASGSLDDLEIIQEEDTHPSLDTSLNHEEEDLKIVEPQSDTVPIRRSTKTRHASDRYLKETIGYSFYNPSENKVFVARNAEFFESKLFDLKASENVEMQSMKDNDVRVLVELPPNVRTVGSKWIFKKKTDMDGAVYIFKARLVAKGFTQTYGPRTMTEIWQMNVKTAFLNGHLSEEVYMKQPEGFMNPKYPNHVCKLKRSIYGLKQALRQWNKRFDDEIKKFGFTQNPDEPCVYIKGSGSYIAILILYVDNILLMGNNILMLQDVKSYLRRSFAMKDLGEAAYILGIKIYRDRSKQLIGLCQKAYIEKILKRFYMENSKRGTIPMQEKLKLSKSQGASTHAEKQRMQNIPYASAVGSIMYAVRCTRPDVAFAQNMISRFQQNPSEEHWTAIKNILKYLRNTKDMFMVYGGNMERELRVSCYTDVGYLTDVDNLKSQTGYVFILNGGDVDWKSTKQSIFATSSTDAKYIDAFDASKEAVWIRKFISGLGIIPTIEEPISMYCDNTRVIAIAKDDGVTKEAEYIAAFDASKKTIWVRKFIFGLGVFLTIEEPISVYCDNTGVIAIAKESGITKGARHFRVKVHYLREVIELGDIKLEKVHTNDNLADPFTKALAFLKHSEHTKNIGMLPASSLM